MAVLSIQSHVVYGYAGNSAAVFPLQRLGREVWAINTVEFSNHTGYGSWTGKVLGADLVKELVKGLDDRGVLNQCDAVLSGYLGDASVGKAIIETVEKVKKENPKTVYCCDPVMGDVGRGFYVKPDIPDMFKNELIPLADITCPNQFELEFLTGVTIKDTDDAIKAIDILHEMGPSIVLATSLRVTPDQISMIASDERGMYKINTPEIPIENDVAGTGDMTAAIFLSRYLQYRNMKETISYCTSSVYGILNNSFYNYKKENKTVVELKIIENQNLLVNPEYFFNPIRIR